MIARSGYRPLPERAQAPSLISIRHKAPPYYKSIRFWIECVCFVLLATPFELEIGSGFSYLIKALAAATILSFQLAARNARISQRYLWISLFVLLFFIANVFTLTDRALFACALILLGAAVGQLVTLGWHQRLSEICTIYLIFHLVGFFLVLGVFLATGALLDLHGSIFPGASRAHLYGTAARASGFHVEPGTYAQWMLMVTLLNCMLRRRIATILTGLVGASMLATLSLWAVVGVALLALAALLETVFKAKIGQKLRVIFGSILLLQAGSLALTFIPGSIMSDGAALLEEKAEMKSESGSDKLMAMDELERSIPDIVFIGQPLIPGFCPYCISPQDSGLWAHGVYYFGLLPFLVLIIAATFQMARSFGISYLPLLAALLVWKATFYDPLLWIILGVTLLGKSKSTGRYSR